MTATFKKSKSLQKQTVKLKVNANKALDNNHKPLLAVQIKELKEINELLGKYMKEVIKVFKSQDDKQAKHLIEDVSPVVKMIRAVRKKQIKRIKNRDIGTRNSLLYLNHLGEFRNLALYSNRLVKVCHDLIINPEEES